MIKRKIVSHSIIAAALLGFAGLAVADDKMKSDSGGASTQSDSAGAAGPKGDAMKDCPPGQSSSSGSSTSGAAGRSGQETSDRTPQPTNANPPGEPATDQKTSDRTPQPTDANPPGPAR